LCLLFECAGKHSSDVCHHFVHYALVVNGADVVDGFKLLKLLIVVKVFMVSKLLFKMLKMYFINSSALGVNGDDNVGGV